jgi:hypothetical protein
MDDMQASELEREPRAAKKILSAVRVSELWEQEFIACSKVEERTVQRRFKRAFMRQASAPVDDFLGNITQDDHHG